MPHVHIEYSGNLEPLMDIADLCETIRAEAALVDAFPVAGIRVRAIRVDHFAIADGDAKHSFIDMSVRLRAGRADAVKKAAIERLFQALKEFAQPAMADHSIALSAEMREIDAALAPKYGTIRDHLEANA